MHGALGDDVASLLGHQVQQLVDNEAGGERHDASARQHDRLTTYRAAELSAVSTGSDDALQATDTHRVGARQQLGVVLDAVVHAQARAACQETVIEVLVVDGDCLDQSR